MNESLALASILHDIGKFWQRTGEPHDEKYEIKGYGKHGAHSKWSANFAKFLPFHREEVERLVFYHHNPRDRETKTVSIADWLSSGEREEERGESEKARESHLMSIFSEIDIGKAEKNAVKRAYYPLNPLSLDEHVIFPLVEEEITKSEEKIRRDLRELWKRFEDEVKKIAKIKDFNAYFNTLFFLLQKYTWCVPSAVWMTKPDISLFDHLKTTCAIAICLEKELEKEDEMYIDNLMSALRKVWKGERLRDEEELALKDEKFLLIGGDISGVQRFIYSVTSKGALKGLRGRSAYLELLSESIANFILRELNLPISNLLYCGGGHFFILAPADSEEKLKRIRRKIERTFLEVHRGELYLVLDWIRLSAEDFNKDVFGDKWGEIGEKIERRKRNKFIEIMHDMHRMVFGPIGKGGESPICKICGREGSVDENGKCEFCRSLEELATEIARADYIIEAVGERDVPVREGSWEYLISRFGVRYYFVSERDMKSFREYFKRTSAEHIFVYKLNDTDFLNTNFLNEIFEEAKAPISFGFKFIAKQTPFKKKAEKEDGNAEREECEEIGKERKEEKEREEGKEEIKDFDELAECAKGVKRWAVLRADVDDLGKIFTEGLKDRRTISRISTLSFFLSVFFKGWVEKISEMKEYKDNVYLIYSGGDDLFIVGSWDKMPDLGRKIREDFNKFVCYNGNVTLSSGISVAVDAKYPLYRVARDAGDALEDAKSLNGKDGISFLGEEMKWEAFKKVENLKELIKELIEKGVSRAILWKLYSIYAEYEKQRKRRGHVMAKYDDRYGRWRWMLAYLMSRMRTKDEEVNEKLRELEVKVRENIEYLPVAVRWAEFLTREESLLTKAEIKEEV